MLRFLSVFIGIIVVEHINSHTVITEDDLVISYQGLMSSACDSEEYRFQTFLTNKMSDCVIECALREHCQVLNYHRYDKLCQLHQLHNSTSNVTGNCFRVQKEDIHIQESPCSLTQCEYGTACDRNTKTCKIKECIVPQIPNGRVRGNLRSVGNRIKYECDVGFILLNTTNERATCLENGQWSSQGKCEPTDCKAVYDSGHNGSGVYRIFPVGSENSGILVRCDMETPPGGWTVIQRRISDSDFYKTWNEYKTGFGDVAGNYWLGNDLIWKLTSNKPYKLRVDMTAVDGTNGFAEYDYFSIGDESLMYALNIRGFHGNVGDSLAYHNGMKFTTKDKDNDVYHDNCALRFHGAWWHNACHYSNLNGDYMIHDFGMGLNWFTWRGHRESLIRTEMKIYPFTSSGV